ncbi:MAG: hypothetical protein ACRDQI_05930 [Pseudonocardiaceae bacterium]
MTESRGVPRRLYTWLGCRRMADGLLIEFVVRWAVTVTIEASVDGSPSS